MGSLAGRVALTYFFTMALVRASGKRTLGEAGSLDLVLSLVLGDLYGDFIWGDVSFPRFAAAVSTLIGLEVVVSALILRFPALAKVIEGRPLPLVSAGRLEPEVLRRHRMPAREVAMLLRLQGARLEEVESLKLEPEGTASLKLSPEYRSLRRNDVSSARRPEPPSRR